MTRKKEYVKKAREIRRATGLDLPTARMIGKLIVRGEYVHTSRFSQYVERINNYYCDCCFNYQHYIVGPKGKYKY